MKMDVSFDKFDDFLILHPLEIITHEGGLLVVATPLALVKNAWLHVAFLLQIFLV